MGDAGDEVAVVDRDVAAGGPSASKAEVEPKTRWVPSAESALPTYPSGSAEGPGSSAPAIPWASGPPLRRTGIPVLPSSKHGLQMFGAAEGEGREVFGLAERRRSEGGRWAGRRTGMPT